MCHCRWALFVGLSVRVRRTSMGRGRKIGKCRGPFRPARSERMPETAIRFLRGTALKTAKRDCIGSVLRGTRAGGFHSRALNVIFFLFAYPGHSVGYPGLIIDSPGARIAYPRRLAAYPRPLFKSPGVVIDSPRAEFDSPDAFGEYPRSLGEYPRTFGEYPRAVINSPGRQPTPWDT